MLFLFLHHQLASQQQEVEDEKWKRKKSITQEQIKVFVKVSVISDLQP